MPGRSPPIRHPDSQYWPYTIVRPYGTVEIEMETFGYGDERVCSVFDLRGRINVKRHWHRLIRAHMRRLERIAKQSGCSEMRVAGRNWSRVLPDYEPLDGIENGLRKRL